MVIESIKKVVIVQRVVKIITVGVRKLMENVHPYVDVKSVLMVRLI